MRYAECVEWDVRNWSGALDFWSAHTKLDLRRCSALEVGSRNGGLSLWMAMQGAHVLCSDVAPPNAETVQRHKAHSVSHLIEYASIDAMQIPYSSMFDVVLFKSVLGGIGSPPKKKYQAKAVAEMHRALRTGGELFFAENLVGSPAHQFFRRRFVQWGTGWRYISVPEMEEYLAPFSSVQYCTFGFSGAFGRGEAQRNVLGMLDKAVLNHFIPENWKYIIAGVARK